MGLFKKYLKKADLLELQELHRIWAMERFRYNIIVGNTARIPNAQALKNQSEALLNIYEEFRNNWTAQTLARYGYKKGERVDINLMTGELKRNKELEHLQTKPQNEPRNP